ncbi:MAG: SIMPL domain-containing protein [Mycobacterium sp.]
MNHASVSIEVKFRDFAALSAWVDKHVTNTEGFHLTNIRWALTVKRRDELIRQVREAAVHDAVERAQLYADALGLGNIRPVAIADAGMLVANLYPDGDYGQVRTVARSGLGQSGYGSGVELVPQDIQVTASVDARFGVEESEPSSSSSPADTERARELGELKVGEFRDDDAGYLEWLAAHPDGYVINLLRSYSTTQARLHRADCRTISGEHSNGSALTKKYVKVCADQLADLDQWAVNQVGEPIVRCGICRQNSVAAQLDSTAQVAEAVSAAVPAGRSQIVRPADSAIVRAWADDYIRFENLPAWQKDLRDEIRSRCRELEPSADQVLHATFFGAKHPKADIENLLLYNIGTFNEAGGNGIRFEHGSGVPLGPDDAEYRFGYRYALADRSGAFDSWRQGRRLVSFGWTDLGAFAGEKKLSQVWLALSRGQLEVDKPASPDSPFAVRVEVRPPRGVQPVWGGLVKGIFDGVISALHGHSDRTVLPEVAALLATVLPADSVEIEEHLLDQRRAVLGAVCRLVAPYRDGVKWNPSDHLCVAGELLGAEPVDDRWAIKGDVFEVSR